MDAIELKDVSVYYGDLCALENINLNVDDDEFLGIIGPNGAGKSTLLKLILGLVKPTRGKVKIFDRDIKETNKAMGYVPQATAFDRTFPINVFDVILMGRLKDRLSFFYTYSKEDREIASNLLDQLGLYDLRERQIGQLSGGQLQRVLIARALAVRPRILLLDEPTANIDTESRDQIYSLLKELNKEMTVVVATHDMSAISTYFDSIACMNKKLYYHGDKEIDDDMVKNVYGCPIDLITHGVPHRVFKVHQEGYDD